MTEKSIATFGRFLYLNAYAFLLLLMGIGIAFLPAYRIGWWLVVIQVIAFIFVEKGAIGIFQSWSDKKRKYKVLMERNAAAVRPDTFSEYMKAPCGRLLARMVLKDLGKPEEYKNLKQYREPFIKKLGQDCKKPRKSVVYLREIKKES